MTEDTEYLKLPLIQRCTHQLWKARVHGYTEAAKLFQDEEDEKAAIFGQFAGLVSKFVADTNAAAQEKGLEATLYFIQNSAVGGKSAKEVMGIIVAKSISAAKKSTQELSVQVALMYVEAEKQDIVIEELVKGLDHKNPKVVSACVSAITLALKSFGSQVITIKAFLKPLLGLLEDRDKNVRDGSKALVVEIFRWIGEAIKPQLAKLKPIQLTELETEFDKVRGSRAVPTRYLRSQQVRQAKAKAEAAASGGDDGFVEAIGEVEIDPLSLVDPINVLSKVPSGFYEKLEAKKWQERKEAVEALDKVLDYPKFEKGDYGELIRSLMKVITKDANVVVVGLAVKCIARLAAGLKKGYSPYATSTLSSLLSKFKEKKGNVVIPLREAVDAIFPSTSLEAIQEDVIASLDNKNPAIKTETASFLGRCFAQITPAVLNKKLLKAFATALLKSLNEPDPGVRDSAAEALGIAMKVVGEKALLPFLPDIDPLKLAKIKECCDKAVVKSVPVKVAASKAAPKVENEPKKVLSGGAIRQQAPKVQKPAPAIDREREMSMEEVDEKVGEYLDDSILTSMADSAWKTRLEGIEQFQNKLMSIDPPTKLAGEIMTKVLMKKAGLKDNNFQVLKLKLDCISYLAESFPMTPPVVVSVVPDITEKLGDPKNGTLAGETLMALAEATNVDIVGSQVLEFAFSQKSVKVQQEALDWIGEAIQNFGLIIQTNTVIEYLKKGLNSTNAAVRQSSAGLAGIVSMYLGQEQIIQRLDIKPAAMALVTPEIEKREGEDPLEPSRQCKIQRPPEPKEVTQQPAAQPRSKEIEEKPKEDKPASRVDISSKITEQIIADLADKNWKVRNEALLSIQSIVNDAKSIKPNFPSELPGVLCQRFVDSNGKLAVTALELCSSFAVAMGSTSKNHVRNYSRGIFNALSDNKQWVRSAAMACLNVWTNEAGAKEIFQGEIVPDALKTGSASLKIEVWTWLSEILPISKGIAKEELHLLVPLLFAAIEDRNVDVRKAANATVLGMMMHVGYSSMANQAEKLKPASKPTIQQVLDKVRPDVPDQSLSSSAKAKPVAKDKASARASVAPKSAPAKGRSSNVSVKRQARKKDEDFDASPLLMQNKLKNQRILDEQKLKIAKWNFSTPRAEYVDLLKDQMSVAGFNKNLINNMFHADFRLHIKAIESLSDDLGNEGALIANLDLILKWLSLRFFDTNPSVLLKGLEYLQTALTILIDREYIMFDVEVNSFIPYLVLKIGDPKDAVRDRVHAIFKQFSLMHAPGKLFLLIMDGLKSKNSRQRTECLDELGYLIEQFGTSVCMPSLPSALKEISKQIADRDNSVRSAALNAIVKAYFVDGDRIYKMIGHLSEKDMSYLEERIKRASQNRTKVTKDETIRVPHAEMTRIQKDDGEPSVEDDIVEEPEEPDTPQMTYVREPSPPKPMLVQTTAFKFPEIVKRQLPDLELVDIDYSFLDTPIYIPEFLLKKMKKQASFNPVLDKLFRDMADTNLEIAHESAAKLYALMQSEETEALLPYAKNILDSVCAHLRFINSLSATSGATRISAYKVLFQIINKIFVKKTSITESADENQLICLFQELITLLSADKSTDLDSAGQQWVPVFISRIVEHSDPTRVTCAVISALYDIVGSPPANTKVTDVTTKLLLKVIVIYIKRPKDVDEVLNLNQVLYSCHLFTQAYPRHTWKDRPSDLPLKAIKTLLMHLVTKKGCDILTHLRCIENPLYSEVAGYLKKFIKIDQSNSKPKLTKAMSDDLSKIFMMIADEATAQEGMIQFYEFKKQHPDVDLSAIMSPTSLFFQHYVADGLKKIEEERGPLPTPVQISEDELHPYTMPSNPAQLPQYYLNVLRWYQEKLGVPVSTLPDFEPYEYSE